MSVVSLKIGGNDKQETRSGKNLYKLPDSGTNNGITYTKNNDGTFSISGTAQEQASFKVIIPLSDSGFKQGKSYTISSNIEIGNIRYYVHSYTQDGYWSKTLLDFFNETTKTKVLQTPTTNYIALQIIVSKGSTVNYKNVEVQIEEGTVATEYEAYGAMPSPEFPSEVETVNTQANIIICNNNLYSTKKYDSFGENIEILDNDYIKVDENDLQATSTAFRNFFTSYSELIKPDTDYWVVCEIKDVNGTGSIHVSSYGESTQIAYTAGVLDFSNIKAGDVYVYKVKSQKDFSGMTRCLRSYFQFLAGEAGSATIRLSLFEKEVTAENFKYVSHLEQTKTVDIQQPMLFGDYFVKEKDGWKEVHLKDKEIFDGTEEGWNTSATDTSGINRFSNSLLSTAIKKVSNSNEIADLKSDKFIAVSANQTYSKIEGISINASGTIYIFYNACSSMDKIEFINWLSANPFYIWYNLATPLKLVCTDTQNKQLDDLLNTSTYKNVTHIYSTDKVNPIIKVVYRKDLETMLNNQQSEYETRLSNIEKLLSTTTTSALLLDNLQTDLEKEVI